MTLRNSWPGPTNVTTTTDARYDLSGLLETNTSGVARSGVFPSSTAAIVSARSDMNVNIAAFQGVAVQFGGPVLIANDGTAQLPAVLVSPASGTNYYVVYAKQNEQTSPGTDANNLPVFGASLSTVSVAAARSALPTGGLELATVQIPAGVVATNAVGVTITQTAQFTASEGGVVPVRNATELAAWTPADGSLAWQIDVGYLATRTGGAWVPSDTGWVSLGSLNSGWSTVVAPFYRVKGGVLYLRGRLSCTASPGDIPFTTALPSTARPTTALDGVAITSSGSILNANMSTAGVLTIAHASNAVSDVILSTFPPVVVG